MKKIVLLLLFMVSLFFSCKKEKQNNVNENSGYTHWYKTRNNPVNITFSASSPNTVTSAGSSADTLFSVYIPNAFSPNKDLLNEGFCPRGIFNLISLKIFNKNDNFVYQTDDISTPWNGRYSNCGDLVQSGNYVYKINIYDATGIEYEYKGSVMVLR